uniref:Uncharacterized protein n=1 Tax=Anopheles culicifacies TaxID=139723 RepID=A0A182MX70_9DIPT
MGGSAKLPDAERIIERLEDQLLLLRTQLAEQAELFRKELEKYREEARKQIEWHREDARSREASLRDELKKDREFIALLLSKNLGNLNIKPHREEETETEKQFATQEGRSWAEVAQRRPSSQLQRIRQTRLQQRNKDPQPVSTRAEVPRQDQQQRISDCEFPVLPQVTQQSSVEDPWIEVARRKSQQNWHQQGRLLHQQEVQRQGMKRPSNDRGLLGKRHLRQRRIRLHCLRLH